MVKERGVMIPLLLSYFGYFLHFLLYDTKPFLCERFHPMGGDCVGDVLAFFTARQYG